MNQEPPISPTPNPGRWYKPWAYNLPHWASVLIAVVMVLVTAGAVFELYRRATNYGGKVVKREAELIPVGIALKSPPTWLAPEILNEIRKETENLANRDADTFRRFQDPLDFAILKTIAENYTSRDKDGVDRQGVSQNAWIKKITDVRRRIEPGRKAQWIEIFAEYRRPAAVVAVPVDRASGQRLTGWAQIKDPLRVPALHYYLVDDERTRLPGEYAENIFAAMRLPTLYGIDQDVPTPGSQWTAPELTAGMALAKVLYAQPFASQIALVNLCNYQARAVDPQATDKTDPQITLLTPFGTKVWWGRPIGEEQIYEISPEGKIKALQQILARYNRIDAGREYVDIRYDQIKIPTTTRTASDAGDAAGATSRPHNG